MTFKFSRTVAQRTFRSTTSIYISRKKVWRRQRKYNVGQKTGLYLKYCNCCIWWRRKAIHI